jgi:hypothetical protein
MKACVCHNPFHVCEQCRQHLPEKYLLVQNRRIGRNAAWTSGRFCDAKCFIAWSQRPVEDR